MSEHKLELLLDGKKILQRQLEVDLSEKLNNAADFLDSNFEYDGEDYLEDIISDLKDHCKAENTVVCSSEPHTELTPEFIEEIQQRILETTFTRISKY